MKATIWHNPRCSKSRAALALLEDAGAEVVIFEYLKTPFDAAQLSRVAGLAGLTPRQLLRRNEPGAAELLDADDTAILDAMALNPVLIERPLVETERGVRLGRPAERIREIL